MNRLVGFMVFLLSYALCDAQLPDWIDTHQHESATTMSRPYVSRSIQDVFTEHAVLNQPGYSYAEINRRKSLTGAHITYAILKDGIPIQDVQLRLHLDTKGNVHFIQDNIPQIDQTASRTMVNTNLTWIKVGGTWHIAEVDTQREILGQNPILIDGEIVDYQRFRHFFQTPDTTGKALVFLVNPTSSAEVSYGGQYVDSNDKDIDVLNAERKRVDIPTWFENDTFWLKTHRYYFENISDPITTPTFSTTNTFDFTRNAQQFEDVNAFFHITNMSDYVERLGFVSALPDTLIIDAHAHGGADYSSFNYGVLPLELEFGEGGVDDAEDGKVVVHEFAHALSHLAGGDSYSPTRDRGAMEEGNADYFSASYARQYTDFGWQKMFNWDMHNEFFPKGVTIGATLKYPNDMRNSTNHDREMWSTPLMCLYEKLGRETCDSLVLEHLYYQAKGATIPQMANVLLMVDSMLFDQKHEHDIRDCFALHNVLASVGEVVAFKTVFEALNSAGFAQGTDDLLIRSKEGQSFAAQLTTITGKKLNRWDNVYHLSVQPTEFTSGVYLLQLEIDGLKTAYKIIRY